MKRYAYAMHRSCKFNSTLRARTDGLCLIFNCICTGCISIEFNFTYGCNMYYRMFNERKCTQERRRVCRNCITRIHAPYHFCYIKGNPSTIANRQTIRLISTGGGQLIRGIHSKSHLKGQPL